MARSLPDDFPGRAALEEAGEATPAKVRKRVADNTLTEIPGIGEATAEKIKEAFDGFDSPEIQAEDMRDADASGKQPSDTLAEGDVRSAHADQTLLNPGGNASEAATAGEQEEKKSGAQKNDELPNHALDQPPGTASGGNPTDGERLAHCGAVYVDHPDGAYVTKHAEKIQGRIKVTPIALVPPRGGMEIRDGEDVYVLPDSYTRTSTANDWLRVRSPNTNAMLID